MPKQSLAALALGYTTYAPTNFYNIKLTTPPVGLIGAQADTNFRPGRPITGVARSANPPNFGLKREPLLPGFIGSRNVHLRPRYRRLT